MIAAVVRSFLPFTSEEVQPLKYSEEAPTSTPEGNGATGYGSEKYPLESILEDTQTFVKPISIAKDLFRSETLPVSFMRKSFNQSGYLLKMHQQTNMEVTKLQFTEIQVKY